MTGGAVEHIVCTHSHPDHSPGAVSLRATTGGVVCGMPPPDDGYQDDTYVPDRILADGDVITHGDARLRVVHTPGHASNHVCLLLEPSGLLFTGDHLMSGSTVVILPPDGSMRLYLQSLERLREMPIADLAPGHGSLMPNAMDEIDRVRAHRLLRESKVVAALRERGSGTLDEILPVVYGDVPRFMHPVAKYSLLAHVAEARGGRQGGAERRDLVVAGRLTASSRPRGPRLTAIELHGVSVRLGRHWALRDASFSLRAGERWLVTGPNGAGKTVLLKLLRGDLWPTPAPTGSERRLYRLGREVHDQPVAARGRIAYLGPERQDKYQRYEWDLKVRDVVGTGLFDTDIPLDHC